MIFIPIFFFGNTDNSGPLVTAGKYERLRKFLVLALFALAVIGAIVVVIAGILDSARLYPTTPAKYFLSSLLPHGNVFALLAVAAVALFAPILMSCAVSLRDNFIVTSLGTVMVGVWTAMAVTAFIPL